MSRQQRREFLVLLPLAALAGPARAQAQVDEADAQAKALGYVADAGKIDKAKQPKHQAGQQCGSCQLYQGKAGAASGPCPLFPGKQVAAKGWCISFVKKP
jgi:High potential iron-sulfur protein